MSHRNARLTVHGRLLIVDRARAGWKQAHIAAAMGVSRNQVDRGSIIIVVATDAPLLPHQLKRIARRAALG